MLKKDNKNVAIGKSQQLMRTLMWSKDQQWAKMVRNLFIRRMGPLIPNPKRHPKIWNQILLPTYLGGLDLGFADEISSAILNCPAPTRWVISKIQCGINAREELKILQSLNRNPENRGIPEINKYQEFLREDLEDLYQIDKAWTQAKRQSEICTLYPGEDLRKTFYLAHQAGWYTIEEVSKRLTRGNIFQTLLMKPTAIKIFNTVALHRQYFGVWKG
jgi:hypothetical protein